MTTTAMIDRAPGDLLPRLRGDEHPALVYLARPAPNTRRTVRGQLDQRGRRRDV